MRKALRWVLSLVVLIGTLSTAGAATAAGSDTADIKDRLLAVPGVSLIQEKPYPGYRFFVLNFTQPVDHRNPKKGTFQQRITVLHKDTARPTVFYTGGYNVSANPGRREPTQIVDGNQVSMEYRFFNPSRPDPADWSKLDIWQAASDQHRIFRALRKIYRENWISTGGSKGGMTATYYERFYPHDMDGVVAYVAPNDVVNDEDSAYDRFFANVGTKECRDRLNAVQREALVRREPLEKKYAEVAAADGLTFHTIGSLDKAYEAVVLDYVWGFWQYSLLADCDSGVIPKDAKAATDDEIWTSIDTISGFSAYADQGLEPYTPYYYQAGTQLGAPDIKFPHIEKKYIRYGYQPPRNFVPRDIRMTFDPTAMRDVDTWVRNNAKQMLFVYGQNDPWGSEPFHLGKKARDSYVFTAPGANHGANVAGLVKAQKDLATARILKWAGVAPAAVQADPGKAKPLAKFDSKLDKRDIEREMTLRP
ncbi:MULTISPECIES: S28 family serine protease [Streptomyces]|uniref:Putative secreted tripeptidyl aminopeptidase n=1 Tax=Streptomyces scabiei (strain 87.22) TaxID=680198 RepID=C9Z498_STRSW|nr:MULTISPECIES: S28 family serine protease [Streptomyces]MBP5863573.1 aminopeptidase [Streptomyces sp. LBUM 1484]MBP5867459.1 aminopeptidase [Streptomyces sp. LBUM 1485]KFG03311.1 tripeptidyl aminopeptidase [Streptomyces scabiei]MBP5875925.1 aminopeptidase [Streptomyces sp. LBUM 1477]MBP5883648.1 aminopeptidase [Streptomyces sp. LBUM 1487]